MSELCGIFFHDFELCKSISSEPLHYVSLNGGHKGMSLEKAFRCLISVVFDFASEFVSNPFLTNLLIVKAYFMVYFSIGSQSKRPSIPCLNHLLTNGSASFSGCTCALGNMDIMFG